MRYTLSGESNSRKSASNVMNCVRTRALTVPSMQTLLRIVGVTVGLLTSCAGAARDEMPSDLTRVRGHVILPRGVLSTDLLAHVITKSSDSPSIALASDGSFASALKLSNTEPLELELFDSRARATTRNKPAPIATRRTTRSDDGDFDFGRIELPPRTRGVDLQVIDRDGNAVSHAIVETWSAFLTAPVATPCDVSGRARILTTYERCPTRVRATGFRDEDREVVGDAATVVLAPPITIELRLPDDLPTIASPHELRVRVQTLAWKVDDSSCFSDGDVRFADSVSASTQRSARGGETWFIEVPRTGRYVVTAWIVDTRIQRTRPARTGFQGPYSVTEDGFAGGILLEFDSTKVNFALADTTSNSE